jgi:hypothetical protein
MTYRQITFADVYTLDLPRRLGCALATIATILGRHRSTISREVRITCLAGLYTMTAKVGMWYVALPLTLSVAACRPANSQSGLRAATGPPRPPNKAIVSGIVQTTKRTPVPGSRVVAQLFYEEAPGIGEGSCRGTMAMQREAASSATGEFLIPIESPGPQFNACLVVMVSAPPGTGLRDSSSSGQRFRFELPRTNQVTTVHVEVVLGDR